MINARVCQTIWKGKNLAKNDIWKLRLGTEIYWKKILLLPIIFTLYLWGENQTALKCLKCCNVIDLINLSLKRLNSRERRLKISAKKIKIILKNLSSLNFPLTSHYIYIHIYNVIFNKISKNIKKLAKNI